ncbi:hypothetical protein ACFOVU_19885 [Nocardiopsis sediminis]|uniref:Uncharacterized protein n=1 Tax=Nocardiopsis sediminis TaxID=1778267 RepID=A0ABV8FPV6_9ACTN
MSTDGSGPEAAPKKRRAVPHGIGEDWAATIVGLVLLLVSLVGVIPEGLVP